MKLKLSKNFYYRVQDGDDVTKLCTRFNTTKENILRNNYDIPLYSGEILKIKTNDYLIHFVKPTETLESISKTYNITTAKLIEDNKLKNTKLYIGQQIKIYQRE